MLPVKGQAQQAKDGGRDETEMLTSAFWKSSADLCKEERSVVSGAATGSKLPD